MIVKCLSLKQPYAELLVSGKKTIEVRKWNTKFRGQFLVHASKNINEEACNRLKIDQAKLVTGAIVGKANLYNVISYGSKNSFLKDKNKHFASSNYDNPKYGFLVNQAKSFDIAIPIRGKLGFFNVELNDFILNGKMSGMSR
jgi:ASCH domain